MISTQNRTERALKPRKTSDIQQQQLKELAFSLIVSHSAHQLERKFALLDALEISELATVFDHVADIENRYGSRSAARAIVYACIDYLVADSDKATREDFYLALFNHMQCTDLVIIQIMNLNSDYSAIIGGLPKARLTSIVQNLLDSSQHLIIPILNLFNGCQRGIASYLNSLDTSLSLLSGAIQTKQYSSLVLLNLFFAGRSQRVDDDKASKILPQLPYNLAMPLLLQIDDIHKLELWLPLFGKNHLSAYVHIVAGLYEGSYDYRRDDAKLKDEKLLIPLLEKQHMAKAIAAIKAR